MQDFALVCREVLYRQLMKALYYLIIILARLFVDICFHLPFQCPLCMEALEIDDQSFFPCTCGYQVNNHFILDLIFLLHGFHFFNFDYIALCSHFFGIPGVPLFNCNVLALYHILSTCIALTTIHVVRLYKIGMGW